MECKIRSLGRAQEFFLLPRMGGELGQSFQGGHSTGRMDRRDFRKAPPPDWAKILPKGKETVHSFILKEPPGEAGDDGGGALMGEEILSAHESPRQGLGVALQFRVRRYRQETALWAVTTGQLL